MSDDHIHNNIILSSMLGANANAALTKWTGDTLGEMKMAIGDLRGGIFDVMAQIGEEEQSPNTVVEAAEAEMSAIVESALAMFSAAGDEKKLALQSKKIFQYTHHIVRQPIIVDARKSYILFAGLASIEGVATALFFYGGGFVSGIAEALAFGTTISSSNILLSGFLGGGFFGKYCAYGINAKNSNRQIKLKRLGGKIGSGFTVVMISTLLLTSGIVRATGETEGLTYDLETLGVAFTNFHTLLLWGLGVSFSILSWRKGLHAFSDPYPEYTRESLAYTNVQDDIQNLYADTLSEIDDVSQDAVWDLEDMADDVADAQQDLKDDFHDLKIERENVLSLISRAPNEFAALLAEQAEFRQMINQEKTAEDADTTPPKLDLTEVVARVPDIPTKLSNSDTSFDEKRNEALKRISNAKKLAIQKISAAYQATQRN